MKGKIITFKEILKDSESVELDPVLLRPGLSITATCRTEDAETLDSPATFSIWTSWNGRNGIFKENQYGGLNCALNILHVKIYKLFGGVWEFDHINSRFVQR